ncbi:MAG: porin family protein [Gammaproteobacteria bacterium]|nr:porin family protein [Gammaproteobacteria bacterium]
MRARILFFLVIFCVPLFSYAATPPLSAHGIYLGVQGGYVDPHNKYAEYVWNGFRPYAGYRFDDHFALEAGYDDLNHEKHSKIAGADIRGKAIMPLQHGISVFLDGGFTYLEQEITGHRDKQTVLPTLGLGAGFNFTQHIATDLSWNYMFGFKTISDINFYALGLSYTF